MSVSWGNFAEINIFYAEYFPLTLTLSPEERGKTAS